MKVLRLLTSTEVDCYGVCIGSANTSVGLFSICHSCFFKSPHHQKREARMLALPSYVSSQLARGRYARQNARPVYSEFIQVYSDCRLVYSKSSLQVGSNSWPCLCVSIDCRRCCARPKRAACLFRIYPGLFRLQAGLFEISPNGSARAYRALCALCV